ncbi:MAG TPA: hypothetical protein VNN22_11675 [Verrucomicrobiae bacterium]|nr:hypothetical protein [Verrucomicrobiae bacterium]
MKMKFQILTRTIFAGALMMFAATQLALADGPTAFRLVKLGNDYVGVQSKDKVVQIRSERSVASLTPDIWYVVYYDPDSTFKAVQVKFGAGQKMDVSHPGRILELIGKDKDPLDTAKLKIDSDQAIKLATQQPLLKNLTIKATQLKLEHGDLGPQWRVSLWAAKLKNPDDDTGIGSITLSSADGSVIKNDLHPNNAD